MKKDRTTTDVPSREVALATGAPPCVLQIYGTGLGRRFELKGHGLVVGRDDDNDIAVDLSTVSRRHARLFQREGTCLVEDLGSTNGTLVNDEEIGEPCTLRNGDLLKFGSAVFKFIEGGNVESLYHEEIYRLTITDGLTGIANKRAFTEFLERELLRSKRHARPLSVVMIDIDHFKRVNDEHGHLAGDHVLRGIADAVREQVRGDELFARYGGEEFAVVLPETAGEATAKFCERIRARVEARTFVWEGTEIAATISIGAASTEPADTSDALIERADSRLYEAKRRGRNQCVVA